MNLQLTPIRLGLLQLGAFAVLVAIQAGLPLDFRSETSRRFETPIQPAGWVREDWMVEGRAGKAGGEKP